MTLCSIVFADRCEKQLTSAGFLFNRTDDLDTARLLANRTEEKMFEIIALNVHVLNLQFANW